MQLRLTLYMAAIVAAAIAMVVALVALGYGVEAPWVVAMLTAVAAVAERATVRLSSNLEESISLLPTLFAAVQFGPLEAMIVAAGSMLWDLRPAQDEEEPYKKWAVYTSSRSIIAALTSLAAGALYSLGGDGLGAIAVATFGGALVAQTLDVAFASLTIRVRGRGRFRDSVRTIAPVVFAAVPLYAPMVVLLVLAYQELSPWTLLLFFAPGLAAQRFFSLYQDQRLLAEGLEGANRRLESANLSFASALVATLDARDRYTAGHSAAVAIYSRDIAIKLGLSEAEQQKVHLAGLVHDIGKIGLPPGLLEKAGPLTLDERRMMQTHSEIGERILSNVDDYEDIALVVRHHHERIDGNGYPDGRCGEEIPTLSRIIAVADAYNAMTSDRPYREAMPSQVARMRLAQAVGSQFDVTVVAAFEAVLAVADEDYRLGRRADFEFPHSEIECDTAEVASVA
jgi:HD-GYP domain-containing protein (c-di-GMP phosphodiesterase class II)